LADHATTLESVAPQQILSGAERKPRSSENAIVLVVVLASAAVSWWHIRSATIWYDEAITLLTTSGHTLPDWSLGMQLFKPSANLVRIVRDLYYYDVHPPLYFCVLALWRVLFGGSLEVARSLSALFSLGTLLLLYRYAIALNMRWPVLPVVLYAVSAACLRYAYNARPYAMATFLIVLTLYLADRASGWTGVAAAACVATHYFAALIVGPIVLIEAMRYWRTNRPWGVWACCSFALLCAPLLILVRRHITARPHQYPSFGIFRKELYALLFTSVRGSIPASNKWGGIPLAGARQILLVAALFAVIGALYALRRRQFTVSCSYVAFLSGFLLLAAITNKSIMLMPGDYYLGIAAPLFAVLMAYGATALPLVSPLLATILILGIVTSTAIPMWCPPDYRAMVAGMRSECEHCTVLVGFGYAGSIPACVLYELKGGAKMYVLKVQDLPEEVVQKISPGRVYFIPANEPRTVEVEQKLLRSFPFEERPGGYFKLDTLEPEAIPVTTDRMIATGK